MGATAVQCCCCCEYCPLLLLVVLRTSQQRYCDCCRYVTVVCTHAATVTADLPSCNAARTLMCALITMFTTATDTAVLLLIACAYSIRLERAAEGITANSGVLL
eukprot:16293-Heterococcus_DN1.PRE.2